MAKHYSEKNADLKFLKGKKIVILGYGSQGHGQALNLRDSGLNVTVSVRKGGRGYNLALKHGWQEGKNLFTNNKEAVKGADWVHFLLPDETQKEVWELTIRDLNLPISARAMETLHYKLLKPRTGLVKIAKVFKKRYKVVLLSKNTRVQFSDVKKKYPKVFEIFDAAINTGELNLPKASRETIQLIAKRFNIHPSEILYVDDQRSNLVEPKRIGVATVYYRNFKGFQKDLQRFLSVGTQKSSACRV